MKKILITLFVIGLFYMLNIAGMHAWAASDLGENNCDFALNEAFPTLTDYLLYDLDFHDHKEEILWAYSLPYDFMDNYPRKNEVMLFTQQDFSGDSWLMPALEKDPTYPSLAFVTWLKNYYFWMHGKYMIVSSNEVSLRYDKDTSEGIIYSGDTNGLSLVGMDNTILYLDKNDKWRILEKYDECTLNSLWIEARFNNEIDKIIKRELNSIFYGDVDFNSDGYLIAPMYKNPLLTLLDKLWTINPSYLNNLTYSQYYDNHTCSTLYDPSLYQKRFNPIKSHLLSENKNQCHVVSPRFSLDGKNLFIRFEIDLYKLDSDCNLSSERLNALDFKYVYDHDSEKWVKHQ